MLLGIPAGMWGQTKETKTYKLTIDASNFNTTSYAANNNEKTSNAVNITDNTDTYEVKWTSNQVMKNGENMQWQKSKGYIYNSTDLGTITDVTVTSTAGTFTTYYGTSSQPSSSTTVGGGFFKTNVGSATGTTSSLEVTFQIEVGGPVAVATTTTIDDSGITNTDFYTSTSAGSLSATVTENTNNTVISGATVNWASSNENVATIASDGTVTLVAAGTTNITASYAGISGQYSASSATYELEVTDSTPFSGGDVTFLAGTDLGSTESNNSEDEMEKNGVTVYSTDAAFATAQYRLYQNSVTTISVESGTITSIVFNGQSTSYPVSRLSLIDNNGSYTVNNNMGTWTGNTDEISFSANGQVRLSSIVVTVETSGTPDPTISASNVDIAYSATSGSITYTINNEPSPAGTLTAAVTDGNWLTLGQGTTSPIAFTCSANENTTARTATVTLTYTYNTDQTVSANVTVTQAAAPVSYTTIPALFAAATSTETPVYVTFNNWLVSGVSTNGKNVFVTDNNGNGFVIFDNNGGLENTYTAGDILAGTAVSCTLKKYNGFAELLDVNATDLTITTGGSVTEANIAMADLAGVNTGALLHYDNLTCSVDNNKYYLSDGTTTIQVYNALFAFDALENGKAYNITGIYQQYNNTKEILPRSADDIEVVVMASVTVTPNTINALAEGAEGTLAITYENIPDLISFDYYFCNANGEELLDTDTNYPNWIDAEIQEENDSYSVDYTILANVGAARTAYFKVYTTDTPNEQEVYAIVTVNQAAAPTGDEYVLYTGELVEGDYLIVYDGGAMNTTVTNDRLQYEDVTVNNDVIVTDNAAIVWHIAPSGDYWTIYNADADAYAASTGAKNKAQMLADGTDDKALWTVSGTETYEFVNKKNTDNNVNANLRKNGTYGFACYANTTGGALSLYKKVEATPATETFTLDIAQYTSNANGWYLIASPVSVNIASNDMVSGTYDLYRFNPTAELEWENYKNTEHTDFTTLEVGRGYLYANGNDGGIQLSFTGVPANNGEVTAAFTGWNLIGNPFGTAATVDKDYYRMNDTHNGIMTEASTGNVAKMEGIFVNATEGETITFTPVTEGSSEGKSAVEMNLSQNRGGVIDRAIVRFGNSNTLPKFQLFENSTKIYFAQNGEEYAILGAEPQGEMPVSLKTSKNGSYTLTVNPTEVEMSYLHLIDNMTGTDVDLLSNPSYTFNAQTGDNATRFRLVFSAKSDNENLDEPFAFVSNGQLIVSGEGTLQVFDVLGHQILTKELSTFHSPLSTFNVPGVYVLRLTDGTNVRTQKIVVE